MRPNLTLSGIDEATDRVQLMRLWQPGVEFGILWTETPRRRNRYPSNIWIDDLLELEVRRLSVKGGLPRMFALHVCGRETRDAMVKHDIGVKGRFLAASRVQINGTITTEEWPKLRDFLFRHTAVPFIFQWNAANAWLTSVDELPGHVQFLVDGSGGRGLVPERWVAPRVERPVGFAGGLGPKNFTAEMQRLSPLFKPGAWIDMEQSLRSDDDHFDIDLAASVIRMWQDTET